ncbi:MAG: DUF2194 domain-containing protein [Clostridia bacterium]|nr:DUF2194 domain-containing protein [Clostridia bacterium]
MRNFQYKGILAIVVIFIWISIVLLVELAGIQYRYGKMSLPFLEKEEIVTKTASHETVTEDMLLIRDSRTVDADRVYSEFAQIFTDMKVGYRVLDVAREPLPPLDSYKTVTVLLTDLSALGNGILDLCDWVYGGGQVLLAMTPESSPHFDAIKSMLGITDVSENYTLVDSIYVSSEFMVGGGRGFVIDHPFDSGMLVRLDEARTTAYAWTDDERRVPLVWEATHGDGRFVVDNFGIYDRVMRGFFAASYSLLGDVCVYPVINASAFYLDDFPSQIPDGNSEYITRDYGTTIYDFYTNIWWPDMMNIADKYGLKYTGLAIESYDDHVDGTADAKPDTATFLNFGNMLLRMGGELGYHGYNHQPLCLANCDYNGIYDYKTWDSYQAMKVAFADLVALCDELFPDVNMQIYVPPSNLLSAEGRAMLLKEYPQIRTISGIYFEDANLDFACEQEFDVDENGVVDQPRLVSGCALTDYMQIAAISELNLHFINNHFTHPDDALDPERGAEMGWERLKARLEEYLSWLYGAAPCLRNMTGSECSAAVQRFAAVSVQTEITEDGMRLTLDHFVDEAQLMVRFNDRTPDTVSGGTLTHLTGDLYLLQAERATVTVSFKE